MALQEYTPCPTHGTRSAYTNKGCRCDVCRENNRLRAGRHRGASERADLVSALAGLEERVAKLEVLVLHLAADEVES